MSKMKCVYRFLFLTIFVALITLTFTQSSVENVDKFSYKIIKRMVEKSQKNIFLSVTSLLESLTLLYEASGADTKTLLQETVQFSKNKEIHRNEYRALKHKLLESSGQYTKFSQNSALFYNEMISVSQSFNHIIKEYYQCEAIKIPAERTSTFKEKLHARIEAFSNGTINNSSLDSVFQTLLDTKIVILSVNYFNSEWLTPFDKLKTKAHAFTNMDGTVSYPEFMAADGRYMVQYSAELNCTLINLPYKSSKFSLLIILPDKHLDINDLLKHIEWNDIKSMIPHEVSPTFMQIPKIKLESSSQMNSYLAEVGLGSLMDSINLSDMSKDGGLSLNDIYQVTHFEMDETGTTASSSLHMSIGTRSLDESKFISVNRPFIFFIINFEAFYPIYFGKITSL